MNNYIFLFMIIIGTLYTYINKEKFTNFRKFCKIHTGINNIENKQIHTQDMYGFEKTEKQILENTNYLSQIKYCPIGIKLSNAAKLMKSSQMQYIIDTRITEQYIKDHIINTINLPYLSKNINSLSLINNLNRADNILVIGNSIEKIFKTAKNLKKYGKFQNVFFIKNPNYNKLKTLLEKIPIKSQVICDNTWLHPNLCRPDLTNYL